MKFIIKENSSLKNIHEKIISVRGQGSPLYFQVTYQCNQLKLDKDSIQDDLKYERPLEARTKKIINKVENFALTDRRVKISVISKLLLMKQNIRNQ